MEFIIRIFLLYCYCCGAFWSFSPPMTVHRLNVCNSSDCDTRCYNLLNKTDANSFLSNGKRSTPRECCHESMCESRGSQCFTEQFRQYLLTTTKAQVVTCTAGRVTSVKSWCYNHREFECKDPCQAVGIDRCENGGTCRSNGVSYTCVCRPGFSGIVCQIDVDECASNPCNMTTSVGCNDGSNAYSCVCKSGYGGLLCDIDIDECLSSPCQNGATCIDHVNGYSCICVLGFTGSDCETDIDECASRPCFGDATCEDRLNRFLCHCPPRMYGVLCDTNICHPTPADVVFILDSSISMTENQFQRQLEFVENFTSNVPVNPLGFQISVVTFSSDAHVEFHLNDHKDNHSVIAAVRNINFKPGSTRTDMGLKAVKDVFSAGHGIERRVNNTQAGRFVFLLTDGMSTYKRETKEAAKEVKPIVDKIVAIGIGDQVSHQELLDIVTEPSLVYSVINFNSLYTILKRLVHSTCDECEHSTKTDVAIFVDASSSQLGSMLDAVTHLVDVMKYLDVNGTHVGLTSFSGKIKDVSPMGSVFDKNTLKRQINSIVWTDLEVRESMENVLKHARTNIFNNTLIRENAKKLLLLFTNGNVPVSTRSDLNREKWLLEEMEVKIFAIGCTDEKHGGKELNLPSLFGLVTDTFNVFVAKKGSSHSNLDVLQAELFYDKCELHGE